MKKILIPAVTGLLFLSFAGMAQTVAVHVAPRRVIVAPPPVVVVAPRPTVVIARPMAVAVVRPCRVYHPRGVVIVRR